MQSIQIYWQTGYCWVTPGGGDVSFMLDSFQRHHGKLFTEFYGTLFDLLMSGF